MNGYVAVTIIMVAAIVAVLLAITMNDGDAPRDAHSDDDVE